MTPETATPTYVTEAMYLEDRRIMFATMDKLAVAFESFANEMRIWRASVDMTGAVENFKDGQENQKKADRKMLTRDGIKIWVGCTLSAGLGVLVAWLGIGGG